MLTQYYSGLTALLTPRQHLPGGRAENKRFSNATCGQQNMRSSDESSTRPVGMDVLIRWLRSRGTPAVATWDSRLQVSQVRIFVTEVWLQDPTATATAWFVTECTGVPPLPRRQSTSRSAVTKESTCPTTGTTTPRGGPPQPLKTLMQDRTTKSASTATMRATQTGKPATAKPHLKDRRASSARCGGVRYGGHRGDPGLALVGYAGLQAGARERAGRRCTPALGCYARTGCTHDTGR